MNSPKGWTPRRLGEMARFIYGFPFDSSRFNDSGRGTPIVRIRNLKENMIDTYYNGDFDRSYLVSNGDILIGMDGEFNIVQWHGGEALQNQRICKLVITSNELLPSFAVRLLRRVLKRIEDKTPKATVKHLSDKQMNSIRIALPSIEIQQKTMGILELIEETRALRTKTSELIDQFLKSNFQHMFGDPKSNPKGWEVGTLGDFFSDIRYGISVKSGAEGYNMIGMDSISYEGRIDWGKVSKVRISSRVYGKEKLRKLDLLFNRTNASNLVGKTGIVDKEIDAVAASYLIRLRVSSSFNPYFVWALMNCRYFKALFQQKCRKAVNQANINSKELQAFHAVLPPLSLQCEFAQTVEKVEAMREAQEESLQDLNSLYDCLLQMTFKGDLVK